MFPQCEGLQAHVRARVHEGERTTAVRWRRSEQLHGPISLHPAPIERDLGWRLHVRPDRRVDLVNTASNAIVATHTYGTGDIKAWVQIDAGAPQYQTHFRRGDFGAASPATYVAKVYCKDVDNNWMLQGMSLPVTF